MEPAQPGAGRRTKIVVTIGPACDDVETIAAMIDAGADCFRLNCSHGAAHERVAVAGRVRRAARRAMRPVALMVDLQGPKIRLDSATGLRRVERGAVVSFVGADVAVPAGALRVGVPRLAQAARVGGEIAIGDGTPRLVVEAIEADTVLARVTAAGTVGPGKGVALVGADLGVPSLTQKDLDDVALASRLGADYVALSFVRNAADVRGLRAALARHGARARVIAKIERIEAYRRLDEILAEADGVMVARGDYGIDAGLHNVPPMQKDVIARARTAGKLVVTATQMLESMIHSAQPTRAEVSDVVNAVLDGTSAAMLSAETGVGQFPVTVVETMAGLLASADATVADGPVLPGDFGRDGAPVMRAAVELARSAAAQAIVIPSDTGDSARACSRCRPAQRLIAPCLQNGVATQLALEWGVEPFNVSRRAWSSRVVDTALERTCRERRLTADAPVVVAAGVGSRTPNLIALRTPSAQVDG